MTTPSGPAPAPFRALEDGKRQAARARARGAAERPADEREGGRQHLVCARCHQRLAGPGARIEVSGRHVHTCVNPSGFVYTVGCFHPVEGVVPVGPTSDEWAWFAGHRWTIVCCAGCGVHLGWSFSGAHSAFHGLILDRVEVRQA